MSNIPNPIRVKPELFKDILALSKWYAEMPDMSLYPGDRFHENVFVFRMKAIPNDIFADNNTYVSHFEMRGQELFIAFGFEVKPEELKSQLASDGCYYVQLVSE